MTDPMPQLRKRPVTGRKSSPDGGRASRLLTDQFIRDFCDLIERGLPPDGACDLLMIDYASFWKWVTVGKKYISTPPAQRDRFGEQCARFVTEFRKSSAKYRLARIERMHTSRDWVRELAIMERRDRKNYGRKDPQGGGDEQFDPDERFL